MDSALIMGLAMMAACVAIQSLVVNVLLRVLIVTEGGRKPRFTFGRTTSILIAVMVIMVTGNLVQVAMWAMLFLGLGEFQQFTTAFYHSLVNFTTLGYGDIVMSEAGRLLGALEAANGVVMFGLTTSVLFVVLNEQMHGVWNEKIKARRRSDPI